MEDTVKAAKKQIQDKYYISELEARGIKQERIRCYEEAFMTLLVTKKQPDSSKWV